MSIYIYIYIYIYKFGCERMTYSYHPKWVYLYIFPGNLKQPLLLIACTCFMFSFFLSLSIFLSISLSLSITLYIYIYIFIKIHQFVCIPNRTNPLILTLRKTIDKTFLQRAGQKSKYVPYFNLDWSRFYSYHFWWFSLEIKWHQVSSMLQHPKYSYYYNYYYYYQYFFTDFWLHANALEKGTNLLLLPSSSYG